MFAGFIDAFSFTHKATMPVQYKASWGKRVTPDSGATSA
jgi:hypothetical protein